MIRKIFFSVVMIILMTMNFNLQSKDLTEMDRFKIIETMNKYAIGIDTKELYFLVQRFKFLTQIGERRVKLVSIVKKIGLLM